MTARRPAPAGRIRTRKKEVMNIERVMTPDPATVTLTDDVTTAARIMRDKDTGIVPVMAWADGIERLAGVVTDRDLTLHSLLDHHTPGPFLVQECMTANPVTCSPSDTLEKALRLMEKAQVRRLPVMDDGELVGLVSLADIIRSHKVKTQDIYKTLGGICAPAKPVHNAKAA